MLLCPIPCHCKMIIHGATHMPHTALCAPHKPSPSILETCLQEKYCLYPSISEAETEGSRTRTRWELLLQEVGKHRGKHPRSSHAGRRQGLEEPGVKTHEKRTGKTNRQQLKRETSQIRQACSRMRNSVVRFKSTSEGVRAKPRLGNRRPCPECRGN